MDKTREALELWCAAPGLTFKDAGCEEAYNKRTRRISDTVQLNIPDRMPVSPFFGVFPALDNGFTSEDCLFDYKKMVTAWMKTLVEFEPDAFRFPNRPGGVWEALKTRQIKLPGHGIPADSNIQNIEAEWNSAEEFYDTFLEDPTDFILRFHLPQ